MNAFIEISLVATPILVLISSAFYQPRSGLVVLQIVCATLLVPASLLSLKRSGWRAPALFLGLISLALTLLNHEAALSSTMWGAVRPALLGSILTSAWTVVAVLMVHIESLGRPRS